MSPLFLFLRLSPVFLFEINRLNPDMAFYGIRNLVLAWILLLFESCCRTETTRRRERMGIGEGHAEIPGTALTQCHRDIFSGPWVTVERQRNIADMQLNFP